MTLASPETALRGPLCFKHRALLLSRKHLTHVPIISGAFALVSLCPKHFFSRHLQGLLPGFPENLRRVTSPSFVLITLTSGHHD